MNAIISNPLFSIALTFMAYLIGGWVQNKVRKAWANQFAISLILVISTLIIFDIPYSEYKKGGDFINMFLPPITALLALSIYRERAKIKENFIPILAGTIVGSIVSVTSIILLSRLLTVPEVIENSLLPKSVTTAIAIAISKNLGGIEGLTVCGVLISGLLGNLLAPYLVKLFRIKDGVAQGIAIGSASHALGTATALKMGEDIGAISTIALSFSGLITVAITLFLI